jgi:hypothetical protein
VTSIKEASLKYIKEKLIEHKISILEEKIMQALGRNDYPNIVKLAYEIIDVKNELIDLKNKNKDDDEKIEHIKKQLNSAFESEERFNKTFGLIMTPRDQKIVRNVVDNEQEMKGSKRA